MSQCCQCGRAAQDGSLFSDFHHQLQKQNRLFWFSLLLFNGDLRLFGGFALASVALRTHEMTLNLCPSHRDTHTHTHADNDSTVTLTPMYSLWQFTPGYNLCLCLSLCLPPSLFTLTVVLRLIISEFAYTGGFHATERC